MTQEEQLDSLELSMDEAKQFISVKNSMLKLQNNRDFKKVITEYYFKEEAARLVMAKSSNLNVEQQLLVDKMIYGVGSLAKFLDSVISRGTQAEQALAEDEDTKASILQEGLV
jgi:hypothetical protein